MKVLMSVFAIISGLWIAGIIAFAKVLEWYGKEDSIDGEREDMRHL